MCHRKFIVMVTGVFVLAGWGIVASIAYYNAHAEVYQWKDKQGNPHFTDDPGRVPQGMRETIKEVPMPPSRTVPRGEEVIQEETPENNPEGADALSDQEPPKAIETEADKLRKKLNQDSDDLQELNRAIRRNVTTQKRGQLQRERIQLKDEILQDKKLLDESLSNEDR